MADEYYRLDENMIPVPTTRKEWESDIGSLKPIKVTYVGNYRVITRFAGLNYSVVTQDKNIGVFHVSTLVGTDEVIVKRVATYADAINAHREAVYAIEEGLVE